MDTAIVIYRINTFIIYRRCIISSMLCIDFRIIPVEEFSKFQINYRGTGRKKMEMKTGEYYGLKTIDKL